MPETALAITDASAASFKWSDTGSAVTMDTLDNANGNSIAISTDLLLIVHNPTGGALAFELTSQPHSEIGRSGDVDVMIAAGEIRVFRLTRDGWANDDGLVLVPSGLSASLKVGVVKLR